MHTVTVETLQVMPDASGAPAVVSFGPYWYALDYLGEVKCNLLAPISGSRWISKEAARRVRAAYEQELDERTSDEWREKNHALYRAT